MNHESEQPHVLTCTEVWGGNRKVLRRVKLPSLLGWVASVPVDEAEGGGDLGLGVRANTLTILTEV